jgi:hypothetical protein
MKQLKGASRLVAGVAALTLSGAASAVSVTLVGDANPNELLLMVNGLGTPSADIVSAFDIGLSFDTTKLTLAAAGMTLNTAKLDNGGGNYFGCAFGSNGSTGGNFLPACGSIPGGVKADLQFNSLLSDAALATAENPGSAKSYGLLLATLDFSAAVNPSAVGFVWNAFHDVKGSNNTKIYPVAVVGVPEPSTLALMGLGLLGVALGVRWRKGGRAQS